MTEVDFPDDFQGSGPMYAAVPMGTPWLDAATRGEQTYNLEPPGGFDDTYMTYEQAQSESEAYAGHSAFLDKSDAIALADARDGTYVHWDGLTGHNELTPAAEAATPEGSYYPVPEWERIAADTGRFEPSPYDAGITNDPDLTWAEANEPEASS